MDNISLVLAKTFKLFQISTHFHYFLKLGQIHGNSQREHQIQKKTKFHTHFRSGFGHSLSLIDDIVLIIDPNI